MPYTLLPLAEINALITPRCLSAATMLSTAWPLPMPPGSISTPARSNRIVFFASSRRMCRYPTCFSASATSAGLGSTPSPL